MKSSKPIKKHEEEISRLQSSLNAKSVERDSLEFEIDHRTNETHFKTQISTLKKENEFARGRIDHVTNDFNDLLDKVYQKR